jgi:hypothetical protein
MIVHLIHIKTLRAEVDYSASMENHQNDADCCLRKAKEFRDKACATADPRLKSALEAVEREFIRKARHFDASALRRAGIR